MSLFSHHKYKPSFPFLSCLLLPLLLATMTTAASDCAPPSKPTTPLLSFFDRLQEAALTTFGKSEFDAKEYVDLSLKSPLPETQHAFDQLPRSPNGTVSPEGLKHFLTDYFEVPGEDMVVAEPEDYVPEPEGFLEKVKNPEVRAWALQVHSLWKRLSRKVADSVYDQPELHTLLPLPNRFVIPGSSYREVYYWDSYWVIRGLLASKMYDTAKAILGNLIFLLEEYGYVLNGGRSYYTNRSQPPLLSAMVQEVVKRTGDVELAAKALPALIKEHEFWNSGIHKVTIQDGEAHNLTLSRYYAMWNKPLPESSEFAKEYASKISNVSEKERFYLELASACESGWDYSTRWMRNHSDFTTLATTSILPVDLNAFILQMELDIASLAKVAEDSSISERFQKASEARLKALKKVFWNEEKGQWLDYWISSSSCNAEEQTWEACNQNHNVFASNFVPMWLESFYSDASLVEKVMKSFKSSGLLCDAGIATSLTNSTQQWDFPNGWAPLQHMIVEGLVRSGSREAKKLAEDIAVRWIRTNYVTYKKTGAMHEKYDVEKCGQYGGPGKQIGFGWSNGVVLTFLEEFGWPEDREIDC